MFDWDDLKVFIAAARSESLTAAASKLGIDAATVGRRIARLETALKSTLLTRSPHGLQLTAAGDRLLESALQAETFMLRAARLGEDDIIGGAVRISAAEGFGTTILAPNLPELVQRRPALRIELAAHAGFLSPSRREVDMAVTLSAPSAPRLVVEPLTEYQLALYAAPKYLERSKPVTAIGDLKDHRAVGYISDLIFAPELRYLNELQVDLRPAISSSSIRAQREIILAGGGIGILPCFMADQLTCVLPGEVLLQRRFWISTHADIAEAARVRAVRRWMSEVVRDNHAKLNPF